MPTTLIIESEKTDPADVNAVNEMLANLHNSPLAAQLQVIVSQLRKGGDVTVLAAEGMLTPAQVADLLQVSRPTVLALVRRGELLDVPVGTHHRIPGSEVARYIERRDNAARDVAAALAHGGVTAEEIAVRKSGVDPARAAKFGF
jgi:excisionase family DNA binding protein